MGKLANVLSARTLYMLKPQTNYLTYIFSKHNG
ncbi:hypothetical protein BHY_0928 (plasmid) [Borrelia nietonii YOR]|uniref:Variable outer membrane protein n=1 Tax=Borrelia nietonii YOR TaxID=1293576 RepID=A0ABM5PI36_9SPIR|nr:hypothetical protein BHY_0928 [Borrelia nietonii YOR]